MKKLLLTIAMIALGLTVNAQGFGQEDLYASGRLNFRSTETSSNFTLSPSMGYFISDNIALEGGITIGTGSNDVSNTDTTTFGVDVGGVYFFSPDEEFSFTIGAGLSYDTETTEVAGVDGPSENTIGITVSPGISYFISESVTLRLSAGDLSYRSTSVNGASTGVFNLRVSSTLGLGFRYKF